jgi:imidazolonepropionase-like amidohydrolase
VSVHGLDQGDSPRVRGVARLGQAARFPFGESAGEIGVVAEGARADLLVVDGDPTENLDWLQHQGKHMKAIMKDGKLYKNELT